MNEIQDFFILFGDAQIEMKGWRLTNVGYAGWTVAVNTNITGM